MERTTTTVCPFIADVPDCTIVDGNIHVSAGEWCIAMSLRNFQLWMAKAERAIAEHEAKRAEVIYLEMRAADHATRSVG